MYLLYKFRKEKYIDNNYLYHLCVDNTFINYNISSVGLNNFKIETLIYN